MFYTRCAVIFFGLLSLGRCEKAENIVRAKLETCAGCKLYNLPDLKAFIFEDFTQYEDTELKLIAGSTPLLSFLGKNDEVVEKLNLLKMSRAECNELLVKHGFEKKKPKTPVADEL